MAPPAIVPPVAQVPWPLRLPKSESVRVESVLASVELLVTETVKTTDPPVSGTDVGLAVLVTVMSGRTSIVVGSVSLLLPGVGSLVALVTVAVLLCVPSVVVATVTGIVMVHVPDGGKLARSQSTSFPVAAQEPAVAVGVPLTVKAAGTRSSTWTFAAKLGPLFVTTTV